MRKERRGNIFFKDGRLRWVWLLNNYCGKLLYLVIGCNILLCFLLRFCCGVWSFLYELIQHHTHTHTHMRVLLLVKQMLRAFAGDLEIADVFLAVLSARRWLLCVITHVWSILLLIPASQRHNVGLQQQRCIIFGQTSEAEGNSAGLWVTSVSLGGEFEVLEHWGWWERRSLAVWVVQHWEELTLFSATHSLMWK